MPRTARPSPPGALDLPKAEAHDLVEELEKQMKEAAGRLEFGKKPPSCATRSLSCANSSKMKQCPSGTAAGARGTRGGREGGIVTGGAGI